MCIRKSKKFFQPAPPFPVLGQSPGGGSSGRTKWSRKDLLLLQIQVAKDVFHRDALQAGRGKDFLRWPEDRDQPGVRLLKAQLGGQVFLRARPGHRDIQTDQVSLRLPAGDVFGETGSEVDQAASPRQY